MNPKKIKQLLIILSPTFEENMMKAIILFTIIFLMCFVETVFSADKVVVVPLVDTQYVAGPTRIKKIIATYNITIPADIWHTQYSYCPIGYIAIGGGYDVGTAGFRKLHAIMSYPASSGANSIWVVTVYNRTVDPVTTDLKIYAICAYGDYE